MVLNAKRSAKLATLFCLTSLIVPAAFCAVPKTQHGGSFHISQEWHLGGTGGWGQPTLDPQANKLYIPRTNRISVVDTEDGHLVAEVAGFVSARAVVLDETGRYGFGADLTDGSQGFVRVFDRSSLQTVQSVPVGVNPTAVIFDAETDTVISINQASHSASIIDAKKFNVVTTIPLPDMPAAAAGDGRGNVYVALAGEKRLLRLDLHAQSIAGSWALDGCDAPTSISLNVPRHQAYIACEHENLLTLNLTSGHALISGHIPTGVQTIHFDGTHQLLFAASSNGVLEVQHLSPANRFALTQSVKTTPSANMFALDSQTATTYLAAAKIGTLNGANVSEELRYRPTPVQGSFVMMKISK